MKTLYQIMHVGRSLRLHMWFSSRSRYSRFRWLVMDNPALCGVALTKGRGTFFPVFVPLASARIERQFNSVYRAIGTFTEPFILFIFVSSFPSRGSGYWCTIFAGTSVSKVHCREIACSTCRFLPLWLRPAFALLPLTLIVVMRFGQALLTERFVSKSPLVLLYL